MTDKKGGALQAEVYQNLPLWVMISVGLLGHILETLVSANHSGTWLGIDFSICKSVYF